ncbi:hypothetical protein CLOM_g11742, partial [Closterium sp. NIES-68]
LSCCFFLRSSYVHRHELISEILQGVETIEGSRETCSGSRSNPAQSTSPDMSNTNVFEFGSATASEDKSTLAGYCPVSDDLEPCRWEVLPSGGGEAPRFRIIF